MGIHLKGITNLEIIHLNIVFWAAGVVSRINITCFYTILPIGKVVIVLVKFIIINNIFIRGIYLLWIIIAEYITMFLRKTFSVRC